MLASTLFAQNASSREWTIFQKGISEYQKGNWENARQSFSLMLNKLPNSALTTANELMLAKTNYKSQDYNIALRQCAEFRNKYPHSSYLDDISYLEGAIYFKTGKKEAALEQFLATAFSSNDAELQSKLFKLSDDLVRYSFNRSQLQALYRKNITRSIAHAFKYYLAEDSFFNGSKSKAKNELQQLATKISNPYFAQKTKNLLDKMQGKNSQAGEKIALLLPLSGVNGDLGKAINEGFIMAVEEFNKASNKNLIVEQFDYASNLIEAIKKTKTIARNGGYKFVFGPLENDVFAACASIADYEGLTLISPTASSDDISLVSKNSVSLAPTVYTLAEALQKYAIDSLQLQRVGTLTPNDAYYLDLSRKFAQLFSNAGGEVLAEEWYYPGEQNFRKQFRKMKRIGLRVTFDDSLALSKPEYSKEMVDTAWTNYVEREIEKHKEEKTKIDSADIEVLSFNGIFLPIFSDDISMMASQFAYSNFKTQLLGNEDWLNEIELKKNKKYINGLVIVASGHLNLEDWKFKQFRNNFRVRFKRTPQKYEVIGYDSFNFLSGLFKSTAPSGNNVVEQVVRLNAYQGVYRGFDISDNRTNIRTRLLKYSYGQIIPLN